MLKHRYLLYIFCFLSLSASAQTDVTFWFAAPYVSQGSATLQLDRPIYLRMTAGAAAATVTISQPAGGGFPTSTVTIPANSTTSVNLTTWLANLENTPANTVLNYGILIQSTTPITAYYFVEGGPSCGCNPEDFVLKGKNSLGTDFWIPGQNWLDNSLSYVPTPYNSFDIVATQNGTNVTITPAQNIVGHAAGVPFTITLNQGQTYSATATSTLAANHLVGSRVTSNYPIAITEKDDLLNFYSPVTFTSGQDLIGDQIVPTNILGTEYIPMYGALSSPYDQLFITATQPGTTISVNGVPTTTIAAAGGTYQMTAPNPSCYIQTNYPVYVYDVSGIGSEVGSALLPQIYCTGSYSVSVQQSSFINFQVNLLVKTVGTGSFLVNGASGVITSSMFSVVPGTGGVWSAALVPMSVATYPLGSVLTISNTGNLFQMGFLGSGPGNGGASFGYFSNYGGVNPNPTTTTPVVCAGDSIVLLADTISGGSYIWIGPGGFTSTLQNPFIPGSGVIDSGLYKVYVTTTTGCSDSGTVAVTVNAYPVVTLGDDTILCSAASLTLSSSTTEPTGATYLWSTGATTPSIAATTSGKYWLTVTNGGCSASDTVNVTMAPIQFALSYITHLGCTSDTIDLTNFITNATSYTWSFGDGSPVDTNRFFAQHIYNTQGLYTVTLHATTPLCNRDTSFSIDLRHPLLADFIPTPDTFCAGGSTSLVNNSSPLTAIVNYTWRPGNGSPAYSGIPYSPTYASPGGYPVTLTITDTLGCVDSVTKNVYAVELSVGALRDTTLCLYQPLPLKNIVQQIPNLGLTDYTYTWAPATGLDNAAVQIPNFFAFTAQTYTFTVTLQPYGCTATDSVRVTPVSGNPIENMSANAYIAYGASVQLSAQNEVIYWWKPDDGSLSNPNINNPVATPTKTTTYTVYGYDKNSCLDSASVTVYVDSGMYECIPNAFTPNGDGNNDIFKPMCFTFQSLVDFRIFNRWGQQVFYSNNFNKGWDGTFNGAQQDMGVYNYTITVARPGQENVVYKGNVTLIR